MGKLYTIGIDGGMERSAGPDMGIAGSYSPDGKKLAINRKGQVYWRKYYRGAYQTDVTVMDLATKKFTDLTTFNGMDSWPMWGHDGFIYFVSDRDGNGLTNIWRVPENGKDAQAQKVTTFTTGDVRFPSISADGKTIVFEHDFGVSELDVLKQQLNWSPDSKSLAFTTTDEKLYVYDVGSKQGKVVVASKYGNLGGVAWSPDGKWLAYSRPDQSRVSNVYMIPAAGGQEHKVTFDSGGERQPRFSADGKKLYFVRNEGGGGGGRGGRGGGAAAGSGAQSFVIALERQGKDPDDGGEGCEKADNA